MGRCRRIIFISDNKATQSLKGYPFAASNPGSGFSNNHYIGANELCGCNYFKFSKINPAPGSNNSGGASSSSNGTGGNPYEDPNVVNNPFLGRPPPDLQSNSPSINPDYNYLMGYGPDVIVETDADIDAHMEQAFNYIDSHRSSFTAHWSSDIEDGFSNFLGGMGDLNTGYFNEGATQFGYFGVSYPWLNGLTFTGQQLNYIGVGAGYAAYGWTMGDAALGDICYYEFSSQHKSFPPWSVFAATEAGYVAWANRIQ